LGGGAGNSVPPLSPSIIGGQRWQDRGKIYKTWNILFDRLSLDDMLIEINGIWLDPAYKLLKD
jgi:hypothetical protein